MEDQSGTLARELVAQTQRELGETATRSALIASSCACGRGMFPVHGSVLWLGNSTRSCPATGGALPSWPPASRQGSRADVVLAFLANLAAWGENCRQVAAALREAYGAGDDAVAFFEFFANPPEDFESRAVAVLGEGLAAGDSPVLARRATRLLQAYELSFWARSRKDCDEWTQDEWTQRRPTRRRGRDLGCPAPPPVRARDREWHA